MATHDRILATGKNKLRFDADTWFRINKELLYTNTYRTMILINDKVSLEKYATMSFKEQEKIPGYRISNKFKTIIGARIIKPDGTIKEIDVEDEAVEITEGKKNKVDHKKLAISDLAVGDVLDYFFQYEGHIDTENIPPFNFIFGGEYPILSYSIHCEIGRRLTVEYRPINGAPSFDESTNEDEDIILNVEKKNIPKIKGYNQWISPLRELPIIRMSILNNASKAIWKPKTARKKGLYKNIPTATILDDAKSAYGDDAILNGYVIKDTRKTIKNFMKKNPNATQEELASFIYDAFYYHLINDELYGELYFIKVLNALLKYYKIESKIAFVTNRYGARMDELTNLYDVQNFLLVNANSQLFTYNPPFNFAGEVNPVFEGETALTFANAKYKGGILQGTEGTFTVPFTDENYNKSISNLAVSFTEDPLILKINHRTTQKGNLKENYQYRFFSIEKWEEEMRARLGIDKSVYEEMEDSRKQRKYIEDRKELEAEQEKKLEEVFKEELKGYYTTYPKEIATYQVLQLGVTSLKPEFISEVTYTQEGLVQKAGPNYILNVGKLIGDHLDLKGKERKRDVDIYIPTARSFDYDIQIQMPKGYVVDNLEKLNQQMDNIAGAFKASIIQEGQILKINVSKIYKKAFLPVTEWNDLLEMLDATTNFRTQSIVLKKA
ncbi:MAG: hypothetical protein GX905_03540 [Bacteroidales bacterium]|nr:hypothetical protein [Bacteroidales bacterium]